MIETQLSLVAHLKELRKRIAYCLVLVSSIFISLIYFSNDLFLSLCQPLLRTLPHASHMIATDVASPLLTPLKFTFIFSIFISAPFLLYQLWAFIMPGLYKNEKKFIWPLLLSSTFLFYIGVLFAYYLVFPIVFGFLVSVSPQGVAVMPDISKYLSFAIKLFFAFGFSFEVPIAVFLSVHSGLTTIETLKVKRPYVIVLAFVIGMLLTPPDVVSQVMLAIPIWFLFEAGVWVTQMSIKRKQRENEIKK